MRPQQSGRSRSIGVKVILLPPLFLAASPLAPHACSRSTVIQNKNKRLPAVYNTNSPIHSLDENEATVDLVLIQPFLLSYVNANVMQTIEPGPLS